MNRILILILALTGCQCARVPAFSERATSARPATVTWVDGLAHPEAGPRLTPLYAPGAQNAVVWLPDGTFWNGDFELALFDAEGRPLRFGPRQFVSGGLPVVRATAAADGNSFDVTAFMPWRGGDQDSLPWTLVSVTARPSTHPAAASDAGSLRLAARSGGPRWHFLDARATAPDSFTYQVRDRRLLRDQRLIAYVAGAGIRAEPGNPDDGATRRHSQTYGGRMTGQATTARGGGAEWRIWLAPPGAVAPGGKPPDAARSTADLLARTVRAWRQELAIGAQYQVPDSGTQAVLDAAHALLVGTRSRSEGRLWFPGSPFQYRDYFLRDGARVVRALDLWGRHDLSRAALVNLFEFQWPSGAILSQRGQLDGTGQALWALGQHADLAGDTEASRALLPAALRATDWIRLQRRTTSEHGGPAGGLLPYSDPRDNENLCGHLLGTDAWALAGIDAVLRMEDRRGPSPAADTLRAESAEYRARLLSVSDREARRQARPLPPAIELGAREWGNWSMSYPCGVLAASDARATALDRFVRRRFYVDGLPTVSGRDTLHCYLGFDLTQAALRRGERATVGADLGAAVRHTQPDGHGLEILAHAVPDYAEDLPPHATFAALFTDLVRSALVYESGDSLVLLGGAPDSWFDLGRAAIVATGVPTHAGPATFEVRRTSPDTLQLRVRVPARTEVRLPDSLRLIEVREAGTKEQATSTGPHAFSVPAGTGTWIVRLGRPGPGAGVTP